MDSNRISLIKHHKLSYFFLFLLCIILSLISIVFFIRFIFKPNTGLVDIYPEVEIKNNKIIYSPRASFSQISAAGIIPGKDLILAINGISIKNTRDLIEADLTIWAFDNIAIDVQRKDGTTETIHITPEFNLFRIDWIISLVFSLILGFTAFFLLFNGYNNVPTILTMLFSLFYMLFTCVKPFYFESILSIILIQPGEIVSWLFLIFVLFFPRPRTKHWLRQSLCILIIILCLCFISIRIFYYSNWLITGKEIWYKNYNYLSQLQNISDIVFYIVCFAFLITAYIKTNEKDIKKHIEWIIAGALISIPPFLFFDQLPFILQEYLGQRIGMGNFACLFLSFLPLFFIVGFIKYRIKTIKYSLLKYIIYFVSGFAIFAFFSIIYSPLQSLLMKNCGFSIQLAVFLLFTFVYIIFFPIRSIFLKAVDRIFKKNKTLEHNKWPESEFEPEIIEKKRLLSQKILTELKPLVNGISKWGDSHITRMLNPMLKIEHYIKYPLTEKQALEFRKQIESEINRSLFYLQENIFNLKNFFERLSFLLDTKSISNKLNDSQAIIKGAQRHLQDRLFNINCKTLVEKEVKVFGNTDELKKAIILILENAIESLYGIRDYIEISSNIQGKTIYIQIQDNGRGIAQKELKKIFYPFYSTKDGHMGLGLYFCRFFVLKNGGTIHIKSNQAQGTTVIIMLPVMQ